MNIKLTTQSAEETRSIGAVIGRSVDGPLALLLQGDYGAGKTTFVQGLASGLGIADPVRSPSYNILKRYESSHGVLVHVDLYRAGSQADVDELAISDLAEESGIVAIEWPKPAANYRLDMPTVSVEFVVPPNAVNDGGEEEPRELTFECGEDCPISVIEVLVALAG